MEREAVQTLEVSEGMGTWGLAQARGQEVCPYKPLQHIWRAGASITAFRAGGAVHGGGSSQLDAQAVTPCVSCEAARIDYVLYP